MKRVPIDEGTASPERAVHMMLSGRRGDVTSPFYRRSHNVLTKADQKTRLIQCLTVALKVAEECNLKGLGDESHNGEA